MLASFALAQSEAMKEVSMRTSRHILLFLALVSSLGSLNLLRAQEKRIKRDELPTAVKKTVAEQSQGATVRGFTTEVEKGQRFYEVELTINGHGKDVSMDERGKVVEVEEDISMNSLPPAVREGLIAAAGKGTISKIESLTRKGKLVAYEALVKTGTRSAEIQVGLDGKKLAHPE
jgi:hypothetical protein